jgi:AbrB family looped-hinge helix DNA binding protein
VSLVKVKDKYQVTLPVEVRRKAGLAVGDLLEAKVKGKLITLTPKAVVNRALLDKQLEEGLEDVRRGRVSGPYTTAEELIADLHKKRGRAARRTKRTKRS